MTALRLTRRQALRRGAGWAAAAALGLPGLRLRAASVSVKDFDARDFGAAGDGVHLDTAALQRAIDAAAAAGGGARVLLRGNGRYLTGTLELRGGIDFHLAEGAVLVPSPRRSDYARSAPAPYGGPFSPLLRAAGVAGLRISGGGRIEGNAAAFMDHYDRPNGWWRPRSWRPRMLVCESCRDLLVSSLTIEDTPEWAVDLLGCENARVEDLTIRNNLEIPNSDGIDVDHCRNVEITRCRIACGDDAISVKTTYQPKDYGPCEHVRVSDCVLETQDSGVKIGTHCHHDLRDVRFERCEVRTSSRGIAIQMRDEGQVSGIEFADIQLVARYNSPPWWGRGEAISITAHPRTPEMKMGTLSGIKVRNVTGRAENSVRVSGSKECRIRDVALEHIALTFERWTSFPGGIFDNRPTTAYPELEPHGTPGFSLRCADQLALRDCEVKWGANCPDYFSHALEADHVTGLELSNFRGLAAHPGRDRAMAISS